MKKKLFAIAGAVLLTAALSSCAKCDVCTKKSARSITVCENHYGSHHDYEKVLKTYRDLGYRCKSR